MNEAWPEFKTTLFAQGKQLPGYVVRDAESEYLDLMQDEEEVMGAIVGASINYRLALGPNAGRKALTLQAVPVRTEPRKDDEPIAKANGLYRIFR